MERLEHQVPKFDMEPMVTLPILGIPVPRRIALAIGAVIVLSVMLNSLGLSSQAFTSWALPILVFLAVAYGFIRPEQLTADRWAIILWEYLILPKYLPWIPGAGQTKKPAGRQRPSSSASVRELWRQQP